MDPSVSQINPIYPPEQQIQDPPSVQSTLTTLSLHPHPEGGYFTNTDRHPLRVPNPHSSSSSSSSSSEKETRAASSSIIYFLTPSSPLGVFHRNSSRTVHTLHRGRGRYVILHVDGTSQSLNQEGGKGKASIESFVVGNDIQHEERLQWVVDGGDYKASYLLPDREGGIDTEGLLISETVVPGFEYADHDFLCAETMDELLEPDQVRRLHWMLKSV